MTRVRCKKNATLEERLRLHSIVAPSGCWIWVGCRKNGYASLFNNGRSRYGHRLSYEYFVGQIPSGYQIDHLCRRPACINPEHLDAVPAAVNVLRGTSPGARSARRDMCTRGHRYAEHSVFYVGRRFCRECMRINKRAFDERQRAKRVAA